MTAISLTAETTRREPVSIDVGAFVAEFWAGACDGMNIETRYNTLARMSAAELAQHGLTREDIGRVAVTGKVR